MKPEPALQTVAVLDHLETPEGPLLDFARAYLHRSGEWHPDLSPAEKAAQLRNLFDLVDSRQPNTISVRVYNPNTQDHGYTCRGTVLEFVTDDGPFLVDSITNEITAHDLRVARVVHPVIGTVRDSQGRLVAVTPARGAPTRESVQHYELNRTISDDLAHQLEKRIRSVLGDVAAVVLDFHPMRDSIDRMVAATTASSEFHSPEDVAETIAFLEWLRDDNFVFLGYREYLIEYLEEKAWLSVVEGSGLGILSDPATSRAAEPTLLESLPTFIQERWTERRPIVVTKTNRLSTVHRRVKMDYVGIPRVDAQGRVIGELRLIGLFTSRVYMSHTASIPLLRRKLNQIISAEDLIEGSHDYKKVIEIFESFPRDELFSTPTDEVGISIMGLLDLEERQNVRLFVRRDYLERSASIVVALPRDYYSARLRKQLQELFKERFNGESIDFRLTLGQSTIARIHFTVWVAGETIPDVSYEELEAEVVTLARSWDDRMAELMVQRHGDDRGFALIDRWAHLLPEYYRTSMLPEVSVNDITKLDALHSSDDDILIGLQNEPGPGEQLTRIALYRKQGKLRLSQIVPILEDLGLSVVEEVPTRLRKPKQQTVIHDFGVLDTQGRQLDVDACGERTSATITAILGGNAVSDSLNRLILLTQLDHDQIEILRAYRTYWRRVAPAYTIGYVNDALAGNPTIAQSLVRLFEERFRPEGNPDREAEFHLELIESLDALESLEEDRILRGFMNLIEATTRTNAYLPHRQSLSFKLFSADVPDMPLPRPLYEIFVFAPEVEGIHLRGGMVARGGLRWSDRREDYRTEVLGLMKAQMTKNAVIVPTGSKGGFVVQNPPTDKAALAKAVEEAYSIFIRGLLDITDNLVGGQAVHPPGVRIHDRDDPYLVVAADKGTAKFSDTANAIAAEYEFWLDDAFASGGSAGYDHKALGITARGAWESVRLHFREMGQDVQVDPFTVVGIGDMSGDVFGNGMLLSRAIRLVAAFDHRHIFIDPNPDAAAGYEERQRLFDLPTSSWDDYDRSAISEGGGVYPRSIKRIELSDQARAALDIETNVAAPSELITAILRAPVDLLWNGGIGTYVKATSETSEQVGDRINDPVRINGTDLRCHIVAEGGNLGFTQRGRIEFATKGGRINTDFIDNSGGVHCSDREVNLKILLSLAIDQDRLTLEDRNELVADMAGDVVGAVVYDNFLQAQILAQEVAAAPHRVEALEDLMHTIEVAGSLDRNIERLPSTEEMSERANRGLGLTTPELSVLLAYSKSSLTDALLATDLPDSDVFLPDLEAYFPTAARDQFGDLIPNHPLRRELVATILANQLVNAQGTTFVTRLMDETGAHPADVVRAYRVAREISGADKRWQAIEELGASIEPGLGRHMMWGVDDLVESLTRWYLTRSRSQSIDSLIAEAKQPFADLADSIAEIGPEDWRAEREASVAELVESGVPNGLARSHIYQAEFVHAPDIIKIARRYQQPVLDVARISFMIGDIFELDWLTDRVEGLPVENRWQRRSILALEDDLLRLRTELVSIALDQADDLTPGEIVAEFLSSRADGHVRIERLIHSLGVDGVNDAATAMVAIRQIRNFIGI